MSLCPLCEARKGKRVCPAKGATICAQCCGSKRGVVIACPDDCAYLTGAHASGWSGRETERRRDARRFALHLQPLDERQLALFFLVLTGLAGLRARHRSLDDALLLSALEALGRTLETREKGLLYEHQPDDARATTLVKEIEALFDVPDESGERFAPQPDEVRAVLRALHAATSEAVREQAGPTVLLDSVARLAGRLGAEVPRAPARPLIIEP